MAKKKKIEQVPFDAYLKKLLGELTYNIGKIAAIGLITAGINLTAHYLTENKDILTTVAGLSGAAASMTKTKKS